jgi:riboflavin kinase/FMN adenylyltransferase
MGHMKMLHFSAKVVSGAGRGKDIGTPTINLDLHDVPADLKEGIYACRAKIDGEWMDAAMHYGPRPVFKDDTACEVYVLDIELVNAPETLEVSVHGYLREVMDFPSVEELQARIASDIERTRAMLDAHGPELD